MTDKRTVMLWFECGSYRATETVEVEDDATDDDLQEMVEEFMGNHCAAGWSEAPHGS